MLQPWQIRVFWLCNVLPEKPCSSKLVILKPVQEMGVQAGHWEGSPGDQKMENWDRINLWEIACISISTVYWVYRSRQNCIREKGLKRCLLVQMLHFHFTFTPYKGTSQTLSHFLLIAGWWDHDNTVNIIINFFFSYKILNKICKCKKMANSYTLIIGQ